MGLRVQNKGLDEEKLSLFDKDTRFVSSYKEAKIIVKEDYYQLSMVLNGTEKIYSYSTLKEAYDKYHELLEKDEGGFFV